MKIIDLSVALENDGHWAPWWARNRVKLQGHGFGAVVIRVLFGLSRKYLQAGRGWANDEIRLSTHGTTHLDAPWHFTPTVGNAPSKTIDQIPLEWCYAPGVMLDMRHKQDGEAIGVADCEAALAKISYTIKPRDIVLIMTGNDRLLGSREYFTHGCGMSAAATRWIVAQGVKITGIDSWGWDVPLPGMARRARESGNRQLFWEAHYVGAEMEYCHLERLTGLDQLPPTGFTVCCFPLKVKGGSAGPARVVAIFDGDPH